MVTIVRNLHRIWVYDTDSPVIDKKVSELQASRRHALRRIQASDFSRLMGEVQASYFRMAYAPIEKTIDVTDTELAALNHIAALMGLTVYDYRVSVKVTLRPENFD